MTTSQLPSDSGSAPTSPCRIDVKEAECYDIAWQINFLVSLLDYINYMLLINQTENDDEFIWYAGQTLEQGWSSNVLRHQIESGLYARQVLADKTTNYKKQLADPLGEQAEEIIKDPYVFDFIPAAAPLLEKELEDAMVAQITKVLMEFGNGFSFLGRQYPIQVGEKGIC